MQAHYTLSDAEFEQQFEAGALDPALFTHEAHLRWAWIHISKYGLERALEHIHAQLKRFVAGVGAADKYNATLTTAATKAVYHFWARSETRTFPDFLAENPRLATQFRELMEAHYSFDIFQSEAAKQTVLEPDLLPFD